MGVPFLGSSQGSRLGGDWCNFATAVLPRFLLEGTTPRFPLKGSIKGDIGIDIDVDMDIDLDDQLT